MFFNLKGIRIGTVVVVAMLGMPVLGQDLLARQAPIDKKMRAVDSVALQRLIGDEQLENPAFDLYSDWNNESVHCYGNVRLPEEYKIDLRNFCMPTSSRKITSKFGYRPRFRRYHNGLDVKVYIGDTISSAFGGKVRIVADEGRRKGYGKYVVIRHPNGLETIYGHLSKHLVKENQIVKAGEPIGLGGNTGRSTGSHLHFETRFLGVAINPAKMFDFEAQDVVGEHYVFRGKGSKNTRVASSSSRPKQASGSGAKVHRVKSGENLSIIASKRGTTVEKLCRLNGLSRKSVLRPGQILRYS